QVLIADDGTNQVANLFGLDLIHQDDGAETRTLLADGLGSIRLEMVGSTVEVATTYDPYGNTLAQSGASNTAYGFTGEQADKATGLLYLRARYYNPGLRLFMARDPWSGDQQAPLTMHGYAYGLNNPANYVDPSGNTAIPAGIVVCYGIAFVIPDPLFIEEGICTVIAAGAVGVIVIGALAADLAIDGDLDIGNILLNCLPPPPRIGTKDRGIPIRNGPGLQPAPQGRSRLQPQNRPRPQPFPLPIKPGDPVAPQIPDQPDQPQVIVELGAGDYSNAIAMKRANPFSEVYATNST
ncbi:MAG: hypothetical protein L0346_09540, partial [Chloroflexi bacterium]|nr:hypothetical protein [Chloroflexota bacterium]